MKRVVTCWLATVLGMQPVVAQQQMQAIAPVRPSTPILRWYETAQVPEVQLGNSARLVSLIRGGKLYLTAQDAIALALENNLDVEISRFNPVLDQWNLIRAEAGGALPGVPSGTSQVGNVARGQGVSGSQAAAGVQGGGSGTGNAGAGNATIAQIGPQTPALDPILQNTTAFSHLSVPQANLTQSRLTNLIDNERNYTTTAKQGYLAGGQVSLSYTESYLNENAPTDNLNPTYAPSLTLQVQQNFLRGFGTAMNSRTISVSRVNLQIDEYNFKSQITSVVNNVLRVYYTYSADLLNVGAKQRALDVANEFLSNNRKQVEVGTLAPLDVTNAEAQVASSENDLIGARTALEQDELTLKNLISRVGVADPLLNAVEIVPLDHIEVPESDGLPPIQKLIAEAVANRPDIQAQNMNLQVAKLNSLGTRNGVLPQLAGFASASAQGLAGKTQPVVEPIGQVQASASQAFPPGFGPCPASFHTTLPCEYPDKALVGGFGTANSQLIDRHYPSENVGVFFAATLRNRVAQADYAIDQLTVRRTELQDSKTLSQVAVDVANQITALRQARARYRAAAQNRVLSEQLLDAEQKKYKLGASTPYSVISQQRDLAVADYNVTSALVSYSNARIALDQTLGRTLAANHVSLDEAKAGVVQRASSVPAGK